MKKPNINVMTRVRKYRIGTRYVTELFERYQYAKIDFGVVGHDVATGKAFRNIQYRWIRTR